MGSFCLFNSLILSELLEDFEVEKSLDFIILGANSIALILKIVESFSYVPQLLYHNLTCQTKVGQLKL